VKEALLGGTLAKHGQVITINFDDPEDTDRVFGAIERLAGNPAASRIRQAIEDYWGERCDDFEPECECCLAWNELDHLLGEEKHTPPQKYRT
jgi:hypothetical protein